MSYSLREKQNLKTDAVLFYQTFSSQSCPLADSVLWQRQKIAASKDECKKSRNHNLFDGAFGLESYESRECRSANALHLSVEKAGTRRG